MPKPKQQQPNHDKPEPSKPTPQPPKAPEIRAQNYPKDLPYEFSEPSTPDDQQ